MRYYEQKRAKFISDFSLFGKKVTAGNVIFMQDAILVIEMLMR